MRQAEWAGVVCLALGVMARGAAGQVAATGPAARPPEEGRVSVGARLLTGDTDSERDFRKIINTAKAKVFPAVVFIRVVQQSFEEGQQATQQVSGSGVIISEAGEVLTNWHVVDKALEVRCLLFNGDAYEAKVVGSDKDVDIALLKLGKQLGEHPEKRPYPFARVGKSEVLQEGDFVMAMGAPWGLSRSVSLGIISCTNRYLPASSEYATWLQTDAAISPGNSGGPLVNTDGEVIGINTRGMTTGGDIGFAVPSSSFLPVVEQLRAHGRVQWSWSGVQLQPLKDFNRNVYFDGMQGVIVAETDPDSPARQAGIQSRDRIMRINGKPVVAVTDEDLPDVRRELGLLPRGKAATLEVVRGGQTMTLELTPREKGQVEGDAVALVRWDCSVKTINQFDNPDLYFQRKEGVFIFGLKYPGNAALAGLQNEDIVLKVNDKAVATLEDVKGVHAATVKAVADKPRVVLTVLRNGLMRQVVLDISRDLSKK